MRRRPRGSARSPSGPGRTAPARLRAPQGQYECTCSLNSASRTSAAVGQGGEGGLEVAERVGPARPRQAPPGRAAEFIAEADDGAALCHPPRQGERHARIVSADAPADVLGDGGQPENGGGEGLPVHLEDGRGEGESLAGGANGVGPERAGFCAGRDREQLGGEQGRRGRGRRGRGRPRAGAWSWQRYSRRGGRVPAWGAGEPAASRRGAACRALFSVPPLAPALKGRSTNGAKARSAWKGKDKEGAASGAPTTSRRGGVPPPSFSPRPTRPARAKGRDGSRPSTAPRRHAAPIFTAAPRARRNAPTHAGSHWVPAPSASRARAVASVMPLR